MTWIAYSNSTRHAGKYKAYKHHQRYILKKDAPIGIYRLCKGPLLLSL